MQELHLFEYAIIRIVPRVERGEYINAGVILYCAKHRFLEVEILFSQDKLRNLCPDIDFESLSNNLKAIQRIAQGAEDAGPIAKLDMPERFRWLTATRSTVIQSSKVHPGLCMDPKKTLQKLFQELVM